MSCGLCVQSQNQDRRQLTLRQSLNGLSNGTESLRPSRCVYHKDLRGAASAHISNVIFCSRGMCSILPKIAPSCIGQSGGPRSGKARRMSSGPVVRRAA